MDVVFLFLVHTFLKTKEEMTVRRTKRYINF